MNDQKIILYANEPVVQHGQEYFTQKRNFIDFLAELSLYDEKYVLAAPCKETNSVPKDFTKIDLPPKLFQMSYYDDHVNAFFLTLWNVWKIRKVISKQINEGLKIKIAGPGPNSFIFWLSFILLHINKYVFFIRGDTLKTMQNIYHGKPLYPIVTILVKLFRWRINFLLNKGRAVVFLFADNLRSQYLGPTQAVHTIYPLLDDNFISEAVRPEIATGTVLKVLYIGRFSEEKNIFALLKACRLALDNNLSIKLYVVGFGSLERELRSFIANHGLIETVEMIGYVPPGKAIFDLYDRYDLLCLPSRTEGTPRVVVEAFARGMPVLATKVGSLPHLFADEIKFLEGFEAKDIFSGLTWCHTHRQELSRMGLAGQKKSSRFSIKQAAKFANEIINSS